MNMDQVPVTGVVMDQLAGQIKASVKKTLSMLSGVSPGQVLVI